MVEFEFYKDTYMGGSISLVDWPTYEARAFAELARYKRIYTVTIPDGVENAESMAICAMAEQLHGIDLIANGEGGAGQSTSIGSVSTSYGSAGAQAIDVTPAGQAKALYRCASLYLDIYRGVG